MKTILSIILFFITIQNSYSQEKKIHAENIYGKWKFIKIHYSRLNQVDNIINDTIITRFPSFTTYANDGTFKFQSCYNYRGLYKIDTENSLITEYKRSDEEIDTTGEITYLDDKYLLVFYNDEEYPVTYFYKKVETPPNRR